MYSCAYKSLYDNYLIALILMVRYYSQTYESSLKKFGDNELGPLQKQANILIKDCDEADKAKLLAVIQGEF